MGFIRPQFGRITIESRSGLFTIHPSYGYDDETGNEHSDVLGSFGEHWRETPHPEFLREDLDDLIAALVDYREDGELRRPETIAEDALRCIAEGHVEVAAFREIARNALRQIAEAC